MPQSTLDLSLSQLKAEIGEFLGFGRGTDYGDVAWSTRQENQIDSCLDSGLRMFYFPAPLPGEQSSYDWSFMRPIRQIDVPASANEVDMPDDFGGLEGDVRIIIDGGQMVPIRQTNEQVILQKRASAPDVVGKPEWCAVSTGTQVRQGAGQRSRLLLYPMTDQIYTLEYQMYILPNSLQVTKNFAMGGPVHAETIKSAVKAAAELYMDNMPGPMMAAFLDRMRASISLDRRNKGQTFGYNGDPSNLNRRYRYRNGLYSTPITYQ